MILLAVLLKNLIPGIKKFINNRIEAGTIRFLIFRFQTDIIQADIKGIWFKPFRLILIVSVQVNMPMDFIIIHHLSNRQVFKSIGVTSKFQIICKNLHQHCFPGARFTNKQKILMNLVILFRKHILSIPTSVEIVQKKLN